MSYRRRTLFLIVAIELALAFFYLYAMRTPGDAAQIAERGRLIGLIMGAILGLTPLLYIMARNNDRKKAEKQKVD
jgi:uncharacterized membrane protein